jgi:hypothetical protein
MSRTPHIHSTSHWNKSKIQNLSCSNTISYFVQVIYLQSQHKIVMKLSRHLIVGYRIADIIHDSHGWQHHASNHSSSSILPTMRMSECWKELTSKWKKSNRIPTPIINIRRSVLVTIITRCTVRIRLWVPQNQGVVGAGCDPGFKARQGQKCFLRNGQTGFEEWPASYSVSIRAHSWEQSGRGVGVGHSPPAGVEVLNAQSRNSSYMRNWVGAGGCVYDTNIVSSQVF